MYKDRGIIKWLPFDALAGFRESINELLKNRLKRSRPILMEDHINEINYLLSKSYYYKNIVKIIYFNNGFYFEVCGIIDYINKNQGILKINNFKIKLKDLVDLKLV